MRKSGSLPNRENVYDVILNPGLKQMPFYSPLRYPGGKRKLAGFVKLLMVENGLQGGTYAEVYAGGAAIALELLFGEYVHQIYINDIDRGIYAFWHSVLHETDELCSQIRNTPVTMDSWHRQRELFGEPDASLLESGFSTFFLNRTNRSGIISGGVIGGLEQNGKWRLDARFNKDELIRRIRKIARYANRIKVTNLDAGEFIRTVLPTLPIDAFVYLDPPYFATSRQKLYTNHYGEEDHAAVAERIFEIEQCWLVSYDNVAEIVDLYGDYRSVDYSLHYSTQDRYQGSEVMFFSPELLVPKVESPVMLSDPG